VKEIQENNDQKRKLEKFEAYALTILQPDPAELIIGYDLRPHYSLNWSIVLQAEHHRGLLPLLDIVVRKRLPGILPKEIIALLADFCLRGDYFLLERARNQEPFVEEEDSNLNNLEEQAHNKEEFQETVVALSGDNANAPEPWIGSAWLWQSPNDPYCALRVLMSRDWQLAQGELADNNSGRISEMLCIEVEDESVEDLIVNGYQRLLDACAQLLPKNTPAPLSQQQTRELFATVAELAKQSSR